jgi:hypothetical protein
MPLEFAQPPSESVSSLNQGLGALPAFQRHGFTSEAAGGNKPSISLPHRIFVLTPQEVMRGASLNEAQPVSWQYILDQQMLGAPASGSSTAEVMERNGTHVFARLQHGPTAGLFRRAIETVQQTPTVQAGKFEPRLLRIVPEIDALWLKDKVSSKDMIVPILSRIGTLVQFQTYTGEDFLSKASEYFKKNPRSDNSPRAVAQA